MNQEHCFICESETGRAGKGEDSMYDADDAGPYCADCWEQLPDDKKESA